MEELKVRKIIELLNASYNMRYNIVINRIEKLKKEQLKIYYDYEIDNKEFTDFIEISSSAVNDLNYLYSTFRTLSYDKILELYKMQS